MLSVDLKQFNDLGTFERLTHVYNHLSQAHIKGDNGAFRDSWEALSLNLTTESMKRIRVVILGVLEGNIIREKQNLGKRYELYRDLGVIQEDGEGDA